MTTDPNIKSTTTNRSSLLFSPTAEDNRRQKYSDVAKASSLFPLDEDQLKSNSNSMERKSSDSVTTPSASLTAMVTPSSSINDTLNSTPSKEALATNSTSTTTTTTTLNSHSKTPSIYNTNTSINATTGHLPLSSNTFNTAPNYNSNSKFSNLSQPTLNNNNNWSAPIPATRFDTVTSYVDVIYQQQQQQLQMQNLRKQQQQQSQQPNKNAANSISDSNDFNSLSMEEASNVVYLSPSDGIDGDNSFMASCPSCAMMVMTEVEPFNGHTSYKMALLLIPLLSCWLPLSSCKYGRKWKDVRHTCPKCKSNIAIYRK